MFLVSQVHPPLNHLRHRGAESQLTSLVIRHVGRTDYGRLRNFSFAVACDSVIFVYPFPIIDGIRLRILRTDGRTCGGVRIRKDVYKTFVCVIVMALSYITANIIICF